MDDAGEDVIITRLDGAISGESILDEYQSTIVKILGKSDNGS
jgi:hypothetical protein